MIRVKVLKVREILIKFVSYFVFLLLVYILLVCLLSLIHIQSKTFDLNIVEDNIALEETLGNASFQVKLLRNELGFNHEMIQAKIDDSLVNNNKTTLEKEEKKYSQNEDKQFLSNEMMKGQKRPNKYEVKELSTNKVQVGKACINNYSGLTLDLDELSNVSNFQLDEKTNFLIYHTHTSEAYEEAGIESNFRTTDDAYNVVAVGEILKENLLLKKFNVLHDTTKHDTPSYNGAYNHSLETVENLLKKKKYDIIIDLHRDALSGNLHFRPTTEINGETASKLMFVVGTNGSGLQHDDWMNNLKLALLIQNTAEEMYPGLFRDLNLAKYRYNQHLSEGAFIIEVGSTGNTLSDTKTAMKYLANVFAALKSE